jgi:hypothetical protein
MSFAHLSPTGPLVGSSRPSLVTLALHFVGDIAFIVQVFKVLGRNTWYVWCSRLGATHWRS